MNKTLLSTLLAALICASLLAKVQAQDVHALEPELGVGGNIKLDEASTTYVDDGFDFHVHPLWESRYVSEGRDNLAGKGIASIATEFNYNEIAIIPWVATGVDSDYTEFNLNAIYATQLFNTVDMFIGYNHLRSRENTSNAHDNEVSLDFSYFYDNKFQLTSSAYYSFDSQGTFIELTINKGYEINEAVNIDFQTGLGFNAGYVSDGHNGINNLKLTANVSYQVIKQLEVYAYTSYTMAINKNAERFVGDQTLKNVFWSGIGLSYLYR